MDKQFNLEPPKLRLHKLTKKLDAKIVPHISSLLRDLGVIFLINLYYKKFPYWRMQTM